MRRQAGAHQREANGGAGKYKSAEPKIVLVLVLDLAAISRTRTTANALWSDH
jgi:hypothetical protein